MNRDGAPIRGNSSSVGIELAARMPYRIDLRDVGDQSLDRLVELGALDVERSAASGMTALMPDSITPEQVARALGIADVVVSRASGRDNGSTWVLTPGVIEIGSIRIVPSHVDAGPGDLRLIDSAAFGTGLHPTTALCLHALDDIIGTSQPNAMLDVGTGSGVLALAALRLGVPQVQAIDLDDDAIRVAANNARLNGLATRLQLSRGGPESVTGSWPLVVANILAAPLIEMAPALVRRVAHRGQLVLSGIPDSIEADVARAYVGLGMHRMGIMRRAGWIALTLRPSW